MPKSAASSLFPSVSVPRDAAAAASPPRNRLQNSHRRGAAARQGRPPPDLFGAVPDDRSAVAAQRTVVALALETTRPIESAGDDIGLCGDREIETIGHATIPHRRRSEEHTSELTSLMRISYAVFCLNKKQPNTSTTTNTRTQ